MTSPDKAEGARVLVVDDEATARTALAELLRDEGYAVRSAADGFKALGLLEEWTPDLVITDVKMPGMDGLELMRRIRESVDAVGVVVMTAFGSVENAVAAMHLGADDYLSKPVHFPELLVVVGRVLEHHELRRENERLHHALGQEPADDTVQWIGGSKVSREMLDLVRQVAASDASVLILGEGGSGKELVAQALHHWGNRAQGAYVPVRVTGLEASELDRLLFGELRAGGEVRDGLLAQAAGGTLFLDEIGTVPPSTQVALLGLLTDHRYKRIGADTPVDIDVRVVAATQLDLHEEVEAGRFRGDLYYRLNVITLRVPSLRQRREDLPGLAMHFLRKHAKATRKSIHGFSDRALWVLMHYDWPDNVSELNRCVERAVALCQGREVEPKHLPREVMASARQGDEVPPIPGTSMADLEKYAILKTLEQVRGSTSKAAEILGISPRKIQYRLAEYREADPSGVPAIVKDPDERGQ